MSEVTTPMWRFGTPPSSVDSDWMMRGKFVASEVCSSSIDGELSTTNSTSRSALTTAGTTVTSWTSPMTTSVFEHAATKIAAPASDERMWSPGGSAGAGGGQARALRRARPPAIETLEQVGDVVVKSAVGLDRDRGGVLGELALPRGLAIERGDHVERAGVLREPQRGHRAIDELDLAREARRR